ncbi:uncharacterized protein [Nicotiana sylvestris]|uniref:uncharacterized protein n=1 Tax=Nicotiana sylvestris TaxID=4096 RepID=UPI00388C4897
MVVNLKGGNNTGYAIVVTTRSGKGGDTTTPSQKKLVDDEQVVQEDEILENKVQENDEVRIDIDDNMGETQEEVNPSREHIVEIPEPIVPKAKAPIPRPPPPYPQSLAKKNGENQFKKFIDMMKSLSINVPLVKALEQMPSYAKFMKDLVTKNQSMNCETIKMTHQMSAVVHSMSPKLEDLSIFTIPCTIGSADFAKTLCDLGESINLMPYSVFKTLRIGKPRPTSMRLQMVDRTMKRPLGIIDNVSVRVDKFILPVDFVILNCEVDYEVPIILGRPFLATGKALIDVEVGELTFRVGDEKVVFHVCKSVRKPNSNEVCYFVDLVSGVIMDETSAMVNVDDTLEAVLLNYDDEDMEGYVECVDSTSAMLQKRKKAIGWTLADIRGISPTFCMLNINLDEGSKQSIEHQRRLKESMQEVVKKEIIKWLDVGVVYLISDSSSTSPVQCVPRKGGMMVVTNNKNELIPTRTLLEKDVTFHFNDDFMRAFELLKLKLTTTPIITAPNWSAPFELMCNASKVMVGAVLGQRINKIFHLVYYASKTMNSAQVNYTITKKVLLAIVFAIEKFRLYLMGAKVIVHMDHAALRYLMSKKYFKDYLMIWVLLLQEFDIDIQDRKGSENQVADHLSRLEEEGRLHDGLEINDSFPDEQLLAISMKEVPWFADLANYLVSSIIPVELSSNQRKKLKSDCQDYYWDEPYLFRICTDEVIRRCILEEEQVEILGLVILRLMVV